MYKKSNAGHRLEHNADTSSVVQNNSQSSDSFRQDPLARPDSAENVLTGFCASVNSQCSLLTNYKFVILTTYNKPHALRRYKQLIGFDLKVHLYQKDSTFFKVYFQFPALARDTIHIKDSLRKEYAHDVTIEQ